MEDCPPGKHKNAAGDCVGNVDGESYGQAEKVWSSKKNGFVSLEAYRQIKKEDANAGASTQAGAGSNDDADDTADTRTVDCPPGFTKDTEGNCVPENPLGSTIGTPTDAGFGESKGLTEKQFAEYMKRLFEYQNRVVQNIIQHNAKVMNGYESYHQKQLKVITERLGVGAARAESAAFGVVSSKIDDEKVKAVFESTVKQPADWFEAVKKGTTGIADYIDWKINSEAYLDTLQKRTINYSGGYHQSHETKNMKGEAITISGGDMPQIFSKQVYVIPGGRMRVPIRQFLDTQIIENADRYNWYKGDAFDLDDTTAEGSEPTNEAQTITKVTATPTLLRAVQTIKYSDIENAPFDLIEYFNRAAALGGLKAEQVQVLDTTYNAITPTNWVNGNTGAAITSDDTASMTAKQEGIYAIQDLIARQGGDVSPGNMVAFLHPKAVRELILNTAADFFTGQGPLHHTALGVLENRLGMDIVPVNTVHAQDNTTNDVYRNVIAMKGAIGLAVAADLQLEAQRRPDLSAVKVGARYRAKGAVIDETMTGRMSTAQ